jgi:antitoxin CptB
MTPEVLTEAHKRQIFYRASHRGSREADLLIGGFAKKYINSLSDSDLKLFENLLECTDIEIMSWIQGTSKAPLTYDHGILEALKGYASYQQAF